MRISMLIVLGMLVLAGIASADIVGTFTQPANLGPDVASLAQGATATTNSVYLGNVYEWGANNAIDQRGEGGPYPYTSYPFYWSSGWAGLSAYLLMTFPDEFSITHIAYHPKGGGDAVKSFKVTFSDGSSQYFIVPPEDHPYGGGPYGGFRYYDIIDVTTSSILWEPLALVGPPDANVGCVEFDAYAQEDCDEDGIDDACEEYDIAVLCQELGEIIDYEIPPVRDAYENHGKYVSQVAHLANELVAAECHLSFEEPEELHSCLVSARAKSDVGKK